MIEFKLEMVHVACLGAAVRGRIVVLWEDGPLARQRTGLVDVWLGTLKTWLDAGRGAQLYARAQVAGALEKMRNNFPSSAWDEEQAAAFCDTAAAELIKLVPPAKGST